MTPLQIEFFLPFLIMVPVAFVVWIYMASRVKRQAVRRGMKGSYWFWVTLIFGIFGLVLFMFERDSRPIKPEYTTSPPSASRAGVARRRNVQTAGTPWRHEVLDKDEERIHVRISDHTQNATFRVSKSGEHVLVMDKNNASSIWISDAKSYARREFSNRTPNQW